MLGAAQATILAGGGNRVWSRIYKSSSVSVSNSGLLASATSQSNDLAIIGHPLGTAIKANTKTYFEMVFAKDGGGAVFGGGIQSNTSSTALGASYIRFYTPNANPNAGTNEDWYLGSQIDPTRYNETSHSVPDFGSSPPTVGFAVDTINSKVWVTTNGSTWYGNGDPAAGTTPSFSIDVTGWVPRLQSYYISAGSGGTYTVTLQYSSFTYTRPTGF